jgi:hypothetical protein
MKARNCNTNRAVTIRKITPENLRSRCWAKQMSVAELARRIGISRQQAYRAVRFPTQHTPSYVKITEVLSE